MLVLLAAAVTGAYQSTFCVAAQTSTATPSTTALAKGDGRSWNKTATPRVRVAPNTRTLMTRWSLIRKGDFTSPTGQIQSTENTCLCMHDTAEQLWPVRDNMTGQRAPSF